MSLSGNALLTEKLDFLIQTWFLDMKLLGFINETYKVDSIKNMTRQKQGTSSTNFNITEYATS